LILIFLNFAISLAHGTPLDRIAASHTVTRADFLTESRNLPQGKIILLNITAPHAIITIQNHGDFVLYFGLTESARAPAVWYGLPDDSDGFYSFGNYSGLVELVAASDTELTYSCRFVGDLADDCSEILAANSLHYTFRNYANAPSRLCFMPTDAAVTAVIPGAAGSAVIRVGGRPEFEMKAGEIETIDRFDSIDFWNFEGTPANVDFVFIGGNPVYEYDSVTIGSLAGVIGKGKAHSFVQLETEPVYPENPPDPGTIIWIAFACLTGIVFISGSTRIFYIFVLNSKRNSVDSAAGQLYDSQHPESDDADASADLPSRSAGSDEAHAFPTSPYEREEIVTVGGMPNCLRTTGATKNTRVKGIRSLGHRIRDASDS
jgi:hypothetical protein